MGPPGQLFAPTGTAATIVAGSVATAPTDGTRLVTGTNRGCPSPCTIADGPFVLTDARTMDRGNSSWFYSVPTTADCTVSGTFFGVTVPDGADIDVLVGLSATGVADSTTHFQLPAQLSGGHYFVPAGRRLCVVAGPFTPTPAVWRVSWAGFVPYQ